MRARTTSACQDQEGVPGPGGRARTRTNRIKTTMTMRMDQDHKDDAHHVLGVHVRALLQQQLADGGVPLLPWWIESPLGATISNH